MTATPIPSPITGIRLKNISWKTYEFLVNELAPQGEIPLTYARGIIKIMIPSAPHEKPGKLLGNFVEVLTDELNFDIGSLGSLTCKRQDLERGLEHDKCYYIQNEDVVWNKEIFGTYYAKMLGKCQLITALISKFLKFLNPSSQRFSNFNWLLIPSTIPLVVLRSKYPTISPNHRLIFETLFR